MKEYQEEDTDNTFSNTNKKKSKEKDEVNVKRNKEENTSNDGSGETLLFVNEQDTNDKISPIQIIPREKRWFDWCPICLLKLFCCSSDYDNDITNEEYFKYGLLKKNCVLYDPTNEGHEKKLEKFFEHLKRDKKGINEKPLKEIDEEVDPKSVGFLTKDPRKTLKEGGFFTLKFMDYFVTKNEDFKEIVYDKDFYFALVCNRLTFLARIHFKLVDEKNEEYLDIQLRQNKIKLCGRKEMKLFCICICKFFDKNAKFFEYVLSEELKYIYKKYKEINPNTPERYKNLERLVYETNKIFFEIMSTAKNYEEVLREIKSKFKVNLIN